MRQQEADILLVDFDGRQRHAVGVAQHRLFEIGERIAALVGVEIAHLRSRHAELGHQRGADVEAKRAADERSDAQLGQLLEARVNPAGTLHADLQRDHRCEDHATAGVALQGFERPAELPADQPERQTQKWVACVQRNSLDARHVHPPLAPLGPATALLTTTRFALAKGYSGAKARHTCVPHASGVDG